MSGGTDYSYLYINQFDGGLNVQDSPIRIDLNCLRTATNCVLTPKGAVQKRKGYEKYLAGSLNTADATVTDIENFQRYYHGSSSETVVIGKTNTALKAYKTTSTAPYFSEITGGKQLSISETGMFVYRDILFVHNGNQFQYWTGNGNKADVGFYSEGGTIEIIPELAAVSDNRIFATDKDYGDRVFFTVYDAWLGDTPTNIKFQTNDYVKLPAHPIYGNTGITALVRYGNEDSLLIYTENGFFKLVGSAPGTYDNPQAWDYQLQQMSDTVGMTGQHAWTATPYGSIVFVATCGNVFEFYDNKLTPIGNYIKPRLQGVNMKNACLCYSPLLDAVLIAYRNGILIWDTRSRAWTEWNIHTKKLRLFPSSEDGNALIGTLNGSTHLYRFNTGNTDDGNTFHFEIRTKSFDGGAFADEKKLRSAKVISDVYVDDPFYVTINTNDGGAVLKKQIKATKKGSKWNDAQTKWGSFKWAGGSLSVGKYVGEDILEGNIFDVTVSGDNTAKLTVYAIAVEATNLNRRRE